MIDAVKRLEKLIEKRSGLNIDCVGEANFQKIISEKMMKLELIDPLDYYRKLLYSTEDYQELIEELVVPETWFFRDPDCFLFLMRYVIEELLPSLKNKRRINFLSMACSSGEEPYSIAIQMLEAGLTIDQFSIDAIDVSRSALDKAEEGIYKSYSFRGMSVTDSRFMSYFDVFESRGHLFKIKENVSKCVTFHAGNVLNEMKFIQENYYDIIFCKNLLIYMVPSAQQQILSILNKIILNNGLIFVAPAEIEYVLKAGFHPINYPKAHAFQKISNFKEEIKKGLLKKNFEQKSCPIIVKNVTVENSNGLLQAQQFADTGQFVEASKICQEFIAKNGPDPKAYFLLGLIAHALENNQEAETYFLKTIYLEPEHYEALIYLALLSEKKDETAQAKLFFNRAQRVSRNATEKQ